MSLEDLSHLSMFDLFRIEAENQTQVLTMGLLALERDATASVELEICMRAAHSLKGAARMIDVTAAVDLAHAMEDCFVAAQQGRVRLSQEKIDLLLTGVDLLLSIAKTPEADLVRNETEIGQRAHAFVLALTRTIDSSGDGSGVPIGMADPAFLPPASAQRDEPQPPGAASSADADTLDRVLRVNAGNLDRLLGLAGESLVESRWLKPFAESLLKLKRLHDASGRLIDSVHDAVSLQAPDGPIQSAMAEAQRTMREFQQLLSQRLGDLEAFDHRSTDLAHRLYEEALACRMRPFSDGVRGLPRMVRDLGRSLGKQVRLEIVGAETQVDRDILEKLDAPLGHLLRNAVDHGIESPDERRAAGKSAEGTVRLEARHSAGVLQIAVSDDGSGIDLAKVREAVVARQLATPDMVDRLSESELLEFLFLPGFTMKDTVTEISGRGVGLDVVQTLVKQVRGLVRISSEPGTGTRFQLQLPLTLSVVRTLLADIGGEPYAFPLAYIVRTLKLPRGRINLLEGRQYFDFEGRQIGLVAAHQILESTPSDFSGEDLPVILVGDQHVIFGIIVDRFLGERELVVQTLDARLGKIKNISAAALMEDGSPVLIVDVEDMIHSAEKLTSSGRLTNIAQGGSAANEKKRKRVLVVDDSLTVRELERKLLSQNGYETEIAVDGMDGWNAVRTGHFDLVVTDIDMPRMDGIELVTLIKRDVNLKSLPVMIVSYKDREEDRRRGLEAGADYYLTKGSFHDETLLQAVIDLIGEAVA